MKMDHPNAQEAADHEIKSMWNTQHADSTQDLEEAEEDPEEFEKKRLDELDANLGKIQEIGNDPTPTNMSGGNREIAYNRETFQHEHGDPIHGLKKTDLDPISGHPLLPLKKHSFRSIKAS